ncbi:MAG: Ig-like domain-containing protein, partial [Chloroflexota bacterium]
GATTYQMTVAAGLEDVTGGLLENDYTWSFTTLRPSVVTFEPVDGTTLFIPTNPLTITFNMPMDAASTEAAITLEPAASVTFTWSEDGRQVRLTPDPLLELGTLYRLVVGQSARSANGQATLDRETSSSFTTVPYPAVVNTYPPNDSQADVFQRGFSVEFASPMNWDTVDGRLVIEPAPEEADYFFDTYSTYLYVDFELERNVEYVVTVPGDAADPYGNTLGADYTFGFTTGGYQPLATLNLPQPFSQLSDSHPSDVTLIYRNVSQMDVNLYDLGLPINLLIDNYQIYDPASFTPPDGSLLRSWTIPSAGEQDVAYTTTLNLADGGPLPLGVYFVEVAAPEISQDMRWWQNQRGLIIVADTNLVVKEMFGAVYVWATNLTSGQPVTGLDLTLYNTQKQAIGAAVTDANGFASFPYEPTEGYLAGVFVVSNAPGGPGFGVAGSSWYSNVGPWSFNLNSNTSAESPRQVYLFTDRPIYRPGDTVYFRGVVREPHFGRYNLPEQDSVTLGMDFSSGWDYQNLDYRETFELDENGGFSGEYAIAADASLGNYTLYLIEADYQYSSRSFTVAEYRKPEFLVSIAASEPEVRRGEAAEVVVEASYFFGGPATDLPVNWTIYQKGYNLPWDGPWYSFGDGGNFFYEARLFYYSEDYFGDYLTGGEGRTDANGRLTISLPADLLDEIKAGSRQITVEAQVMDLSNFPVSARTTVTYHAADLYVGVSPADYIGAAGVENEVNLITVDWRSQPAANTPVEVVFYQREWEYSRVQEYGQYTTKWEPVDTEIDRLTVTTDDQGKATVSFTPPDGGEYLAVATVMDSGGRTQTSSVGMWVADENFIGWRTDPRQRSLDLVADKQEYRPGETARLLVPSPFTGPVNAWLTIERGELLEQQLITLNSSSDVVEIPITADFAPNVHVTIVVVKGVDETNDYADIRLGVEELIVSPEQLALSVLLTPQRDTYGPGETAVFDVLVTDFSGNGVQSDVTLALVDLAVLTLKPDNAPHIVEAFYARQPYRSQTGSGLFYSGEGLTVEIPDMQGGFGGGGGGDAAQEAVGLARSGEEEEEKVRQDFRDTAYWEARLTTDASGRATIEVPLPDNLTTWRMSGKAVTADTLVGQDFSDITVTLPLLIRPVTPRFFTVGDQLQLGAIVHNNTGDSLEVTVSLEADGLTLEGEAEQVVTIPAGDRVEAQWPVTVDDVQFADLTFRAQGGDYSDATKPTFGIAPDQLIPVYRYDAEDVVGTSGVLDEAGRRVEAILLPPGVDTREGEVSIRVSASLAAALTEALAVVNNDFAGVEWVCAYSVIDQLLPNLATVHALQELGLDDPSLAAELDELVVSGLSRLEALQRGDGGWNWCFDDDSDPFLSAYILLGLDKAQEAGYNVNEAMVDKATSYLGRQIKDAARLNVRYEVNRQAFFLYVLAEVGSGNAADLDGLFDEHRALLDPYAKALLAIAYELAGESGNNQAALLADLNDAVIMSATGAHWEDAEPDWNNLASDIRGTAMILDAFARLEPDNPLAERAVRWLMVARTAGQWPTGQDNAWSILALTDWMVATGELDADYDYQVNVNLRPLDEGSFTRDNVTEVKELSVPISDLLLEDVNFLDFQRGEGDGRLYYTAHLDSFIDVSTVEAVNRGIIVQRAYYDAECDPAELACEPITEITAGQTVRVELTIIVPHDLVYAVIEDHLPAGAEAIDPGLETSASGEGGEVTRVDQDYRWGYWGWWYFNRIEYRDDRVVFYSDFLPAGTYQYTYTLQTTLPGVYQVMPATAREAFFPEVFGRSDGLLFTISE